MDRAANILALLSTGLLAGAFAYGFFTVVPTFYEVPLEVHLTYRDALMRHNGIYMQISMVVSILTPLWWALTMDGAMISRLLAISASSLAVTAFLVTRFGNVPINQVIKTWSSAMPPANYQILLDRWLVFNNIRTAAAAIGFACVVIATTASREW
jgi:uncharacterized membrane protein